MSRHVLDQDTDRDQLELARKAHIAALRLGQDWGDGNGPDSRIRSELHGSGITFHTHDQGFFHPTHRHATYGLVYYAVEKTELGKYLRRLLNHPQFDTHAKRLGKVIQVTSTYIEYWGVGRNEKVRLEW